MTFFSDPVILPLAENRTEVKIKIGGKNEKKKLEKSIPVHKTTT